MLCRAFCHGGGGLKVYSYCKSTELCYLCTSMLMVGISKKISKAVALKSKELMMWRSYLHLPYLLCTFQRQTTGLLVKL